MSAVLALVLSLSNPPAPPPAALPGQAGGMLARAPVQAFRGAELYGHIDGGAEVFLELGFERLEVLEYGKGREELQLELYRMTDGAAALGIYLLRGGTLAGAQGGTRLHSNRFQLTLQRGRTLAIVTSPSGRERLAPLMATLAEEAVASTPPEDDPAALALLPIAGRVPGSERIIRGPVSMAAVVTLGDGDVLDLGGSVTAAAADVRDADGTATVILAPYADEARAATVLGALPGRLDPSWRRESDGAAELRVTDDQGRRLTISRAGALLSLRLTTKPAPPPGTP